MRLKQGHFLNHPARGTIIVAIAQAAAPEPIVQASGKPLLTAPAVVIKGQSCGKTESNC